MMNRYLCCRETAVYTATIFPFLVAMTLVLCSCDTSPKPEDDRIVPDDEIDNPDDEGPKTDVALNIFGTVYFPRSEPAFKYAHVRLQNYEAVGVAFEWLLDPAPVWPSDYVHVVSERGTLDSLSYTLQYNLPVCQAEKLMLRFNGVQCDQPLGDSCEEIDLKRSAPLYVWALPDTVFAITLPSDPGNPLMLINVFSNQGGTNVRCISDPQEINAYLAPQVCDVTKIPWCFAPEGAN